MPRSRIEDFRARYREVPKGITYRRAATSFFTGLVAGVSAQRYAPYSIEFGVFTIVVFFTLYFLWIIIYMIAGWPGEEEKWSHPNPLAG